MYQFAYFINEPRGAEMPNNASVGRQISNDIHSFSFVCAEHCFFSKIKGQKIIKPGPNSTNIFM